MLTGARRAAACSGCCWCGAWRHSSPRLLVCQPQSCSLLAAGDNQNVVCSVAGAAQTTAHHPLPHPLPPTSALLACHAERNARTAGDNQHMARSAAGAAHATPAHHPLPHPLPPTSALLACHAKRNAPTAGDNQNVARSVAGAVGIAHFHASLRPEDKLDFVDKFNNTRRLERMPLPGGQGGSAM